MKSFQFIILSFLFIISCNKSNNKQEAKLIKTGYYPSFIQHFEIIANLENKSLIFYNPSKYLLPLPPPPEKNTTEEELKKLQLEYEKFERENPKIEPEFLELNDSEIKEIQKIVASFSDNDFKEDENKHPIIDGANTNTVIVLNNNKVFSIGGYEGTNTDKEIALSSKLFSIYKQNCKSKINKIYIAKLEKR